MSLVDSEDVQSARIADATAVLHARIALMRVRDVDENLAVAIARMEEYLASAPQYVRDAIGES